MTLVVGESKQRADQRSQITADEARQIIDYMEGSGLLKRRLPPMAVLPATQRRYPLKRVRTPGKNCLGTASIDLGWGDKLIEDLRGLHKVLKGKPAEYLEAMIKSSGGPRQIDCGILLVNTRCCC